MPGTAPESIIVRAGAGAGKTYTLTHKVMDLAEAHLRDHKRLPRLVVTTFTRKATQELRERLMVLALEEKPHLIDFVNSRSHLVVSTIHGVMDLYLKRYGANICVDPGYSVIGGPEASKIARQVLRQIVLGGSERSDLLETFAFNRLVSLNRRLAGILAENPDAKPFALADFEVLFQKRSLEIARSLENAAFNIKEESTKADWLAMADDYLQLSSILKKGDWINNRSLFIDVLGAMKTARRNAKSPPVTDMTADEAEEARESAKELREPLYDPAAWELFVARYAEFEKIGLEFTEQFRKIKREQGQLEISDLELLAMECIRAHPETVEAFSAEWDHWLIDEYQDTSPFQVQLLRQLSEGRPNFIVGDPQQSIYLFRGARSEVFGEKEREILDHGGGQKLLAMNRRSKPELLLFLNDFFSRLDPPFQPMEPFIKEGESIDPSRVVAKIFINHGSQSADEASDGAEGATRDAGADQDVEAAAENGKYDVEMKAIVAHVQDLLENGARPEDICVLARTNRILADVANWLNKYRLPTHVHAASGFFDRREIRDALSLLKFLVNPHDNFNLIELLRSPYFKVPDGALIEFSKSKPESLWEKLSSERSMNDELQAVFRLERALEATKISGYSGAFQDTLLECGLFDLAHVHDVSGRRESNIWKLISRLQLEECQAGFNPLAFVAGSRSELRLDESNAEGDAVAAVEPNRINLMTVHASKGLEFRHVIFPRMEQKPRLTTNEEFTFDEARARWAMRVPYGDNSDMTGSLPEAIWLEKFQKQELEEHARVLYVALTRAVESVFLSWTEPRQNNSWAQMVKLDSTPGLHNEKNYSYLFLEGLLEPKSTLAAIEESGEPRKMWLEKPHEVQGPLEIPKDAHRSKAYSVTQMLDKKEGTHFVSGTSPDVTHRLKVASQGTAVHRLMELLKYPSPHLGKLISKWFPDQVDRVLEAVEFVKANQSPALAEIIKNGEVEWGFSIIDDGLLIEGQVDLWGRTDSGEAWIIDYKTGNPDSRDKAFEQMSLYALALRKSGLIKAEEALQLAAIYPFAKKVFVQSEPSREQIRARFGLPPIDPKHKTSPE